VRTIVPAAAALLVTGCAPGIAGAGQAADRRAAPYPYLRGAPTARAGGPAGGAPGVWRPTPARFTVVVTGDVPRGTRRAVLASIEPAIRSADLVIRSSATRVQTIRGVPVALLAYRPGVDVGEILAAAHEARQAGAGAVIVNLSWGTPPQGLVTAGQIALAQKLLASPDVDLLIGRGVHVVQPYARATNGKWVAYGLGDLTGPAAVVARFTFTLRDSRWTVSRAAFTPTCLDHGRVLDVPAELARRHLAKARRAALKAVQDHTAKIVYSRHALPVITAD